MKEGNGIRFIRHTEIDREKWDRCIDTAINGRIYAYSFYLDHMARNWDALVQDDYDYVMPLPWNRKFGIRYVYQPFLTAQLGVFGRQQPGPLTAEFIHSIPPAFKLIELSLNSHNLDDAPGEISARRNNYILPLQHSYDEIRKNYSENTRRNIKKAADAGCLLRKNISAEQVIQLALSQIRETSKHISDNLRRFKTLYRELTNRNMTAAYGVVQNESLLASCIFFFSHRRAYYILVGNHPESRYTGASHALIDAFIKENAGKDLTLDFEGSDLPGLAAFYQGFGAVNEPYPFLKFNRLPFFLKWMKGGG